MRRLQDARASDAVTGGSSINSSSTTSGDADGAGTVEGDEILALLLASTTPRDTRPVKTVRAHSPGKKASGSTRSAGVKRKRRANADTLRDAAVSPMRQAKREARRRRLETRRLAVVDLTTEGSASVATVDVKVRGVCAPEDNQTHAPTPTPDAATSAISPLKEMQLELSTLRRRNRELENQNVDLRQRNSELQTYVDEFERYCGALV